MKLIVNTCYSHILWIQQAGPLFSQAVNRMCITTPPDYSGEGFNGYISTTAEFDIRDLKIFSNLWHAFYDLPDKIRADLYAAARGLGGTV